MGRPRPLWSPQARRRPARAQASPLAQPRTAAAFVRDELAVAQFEVDAQAYEPAPGARQRPDQTERRRRQRAAVEHDEWFPAELARGS